MVIVRFIDHLVFNVCESLYISDWGRVKNLLFSFKKADIFCSFYNYFEYLYVWYTNLKMIRLDRKLCLFLKASGQSTKKWATFVYTLLNIFWNVLMIWKFGIQRKNELKEHATCRAFRTTHRMRCATTRVRLGPRGLALAFARHSFVHSLIFTRCS